MRVYVYTCVCVSWMTKNLQYANRDQKEDGKKYRIASHVNTTRERDIVLLRSLPQSGTSFFFFLYNVDLSADAFHENRRGRLDSLTSRVSPERGRSSIDPNNPPSRITRGWSWGSAEGVYGRGNIMTYNTKNSRCALLARNVGRTLNLLRDLHSDLSSALIGKRNSQNVGNENV